MLHYQNMALLDVQEEVIEVIEVKVEVQLEWVTKAEEVIIIVLVLGI